MVVQFYYKASYGSGETFKVGYSTTTDDISSFTFGSQITASTAWAQTDELTFPAGTKYVAVYYYPNYKFRLYVDDFTFSNPPSCVKPTGLAATLTPGDGTKATLNWTASGTETAWVLEYGTASDFTGATSVNVSGTPTKNLTGLTAETTYYARVKADCGGGEVSDWSSTCEFTPTNALTITVADGTTTNSTIPLDSYSSDTQGSTGEFIIPDSEIASISGSDITKITFYPVSGYAWTSTFKVYVKEVKGTTLDATLGPDECTVVYTGTLDGSGDKMVITLDDPYTYNGGNLLIGTYIQTAGSYFGTANFYGISATGAAYASGTYNGGNDGVKNFIAKTTLTYAAPPTCAKPTGLAYGDVAKRSVKLSWTEKGTATSWQVCVNGDEDHLVTANTNTNFLLENLEPSTDYNVKVRAYCDASDQSEWSVPVNFTTLVACAEPTGFHAENITAFTADLKWTSEVGSYEVRYGEHTGTPETLKYDNGTLATNVGYGGSICWGVMYPAGSFTGNYLSTVTNYDVDEMTGYLFICQGGATAPEDVIEVQNVEFTGADDFVDITFDQLIEVDPSKNLWIIFLQTGGADYPAAAANDPDDVNARWASLDGGDTWNDLADVGLPGYGWMIRANIETIALTGTGTAWTSTTYPLTGLTPKTKYAAQVRNVCGGIDGESTWATTLFETLPSCTTPTGLAIATGYPTAHGVSFEWDYESEEVFQFSLPNTVVTDPALVDWNTTWYAGDPFPVWNALTAEREYIFWLRKKCSSTDFSEPVSLSFWTDLACYHPTVMSATDISGHTATLNWNGEDGDYDVRYGLYPSSSSPVTLTYGVTQSSSLGSGTAAERTWGVKYLGSQITGNFLTGIEIYYVPGYNSNDYITLNVYSGGDNAPRKLLSTQVLYPEISGMNTLALDNPVALEAGENLWITLTETGTYVVPIGTSTEENTQWYFNGTEWTLWPYMVSNEYGCVINGIVETFDLATVDWTNATSTTHSSQITGLTPETQYFAQVRHSCGSEGVSLWATTQFTTTAACAEPTNLAVDNATLTGHEATLNWDGTADKFNIDYRTAADMQTLFEEGFEDATEFEKWTLNNCVSGTNRNSSAKRSGDYGFKFAYNSSSSGITPPQYLISPDLSTYTANDVMLSFYYTKSSSSYTETFKVGWSSTTNDPAEFTWDSPITATSAWDNYLRTIPAGTKYISIAYTADDCLYLYIDDLIIGNEISAGAWQHTTSATTTKTLEGLLAETKYDTRVQSDCGSEGTSEWSNIVSFTTDIACNIPTNFEYNNIKSTTVMLEWDRTGGASAWQISINGEEDTPVPVGLSNLQNYTDTHAVFMLVGLTEETDYSLRIRANCTASSDGYSEWSSPITFKTLEACGKPTGVTVINSTHYTADLEWTGDSDYFTVQYRTAPSIDPIFTEDFSNGIGGWTMVNCNASTGINNGVFRFHWSDNPPQYLISPEITGITSEGLIQFVYYNNSTTWEESFQVGLSSTDTDTDSFTWSATVTVKDMEQHTYEAVVPAGTKYMAIKLMSDDKYYFYVDDIVIGTPISAGAWQTVSPNPTSAMASLSGLTAGTKYEVKVAPSCDATLESDVINFTTIAEREKYFETAGSWSTASNWMDELVPTSVTDDVIIRANATIPSGTNAYANNIIFEGTSMITVESGASLTINGNVTNGGSGKIYVRDGGQLIHKNSVYATVQKGITAPSSWKGTSDTDGWYLIATPVSSTHISSTFAGTIDLFIYDEATAYWWSYNNGSHTFSYINRGTGYLNACQYTQTVNYAGSMISTESAESISLSYAYDGSSTDVKGFNLVGNPFTRNLVAGDVKWGDETNITYLTMNSARTDFTTVNISERPIQVGEAFFVQATAEGQSLEFNPTTAKSSNNGYIRIVAGNENGSDNAYINLANGNTLRKFNIANGTKVYVMDGDEEYSAARIEELAGSMPVNFKAVEDGNYTITVNAKNIEPNTMILVDAFTGEEVNLLETPNYSFKATTNDEENRFKIIFDCNTYTGIEENLAGEIFAYQYGNEIIVNGEGTLEVFDVMGRMVLNTQVNGVQKVNVPANAVYIFRMVGETIQTQKIVVR